MKFEYTVYVPSLDRKIFILELTTGQQKEIIKALQGNQTYEFTSNVNNLLREVICDPTINVNTLTLIDKLLILMRLRSISISDKVEYSFECKKCLKEVKTAITLSTLIDRINVLNFPFACCEVQNLYIVNCDLPTVATELDYEESKKLTFADTADLGKLYSELFIHDLAFFVRNVIVPNHNSTNTIEIHNMPYEERCEVLEKLPAKLLQGAWQQIKTIKKALNFPLITATCLCGEKVIDLHLGLNNPTYVSFLRSLFNYDLHNMYQTIYYMVNVLKFTPEYIEKMVPGERELYWGYYNKDKKEKQDEPINIIPEQQESA